MARPSPTRFVFVRLCVNKLSHLSCKLKITLLSWHVGTLIKLSLHQTVLSCACDRELRFTMEPSYPVGYIGSL